MGVLCNFCPQTKENGYYLFKMADDLAGEEFVKLSPSSLAQFIDQHVTFTLCDGRKISGFVYTIDPVSYCVVMVQNNDENITFIMGHSVKLIARTEHDGHQESIKFMDSFVNRDNKLYSKDELIDKKEKLKDWLSKNRIPVQEKDDRLHVMGLLWIEQPYDSESCRCTNEIVLNRVRNLIENIPS